MCTNLLSSLSPFHTPFSTSDLSKPAVFVLSRCKRAPCCMLIRCITHGSKEMCCRSVHTRYTLFPTLSRPCLHHMLLHYSVEYTYFIRGHAMAFLCLLLVTGRPHMSSAITRTPSPLWLGMQQQVPTKEGPIPTIHVPNKNGWALNMRGDCTMRN